MVDYLNAGLRDNSNVGIVHGQARIRGTRIPVSVILDYLAAGMTEGQICTEYPSLPPGAVAASLVYEAALAR